MGAERTVNRFNGAVRECLEECYQSEHRLASLAKFVDRLRSDGWDNKEIEEVEIVVHHLLKAIVHPDDIPNALAALPDYSQADYSRTEK